MKKIIFNNKTPLSLFAAFFFLFHTSFATTNPSTEKKQRVQPFANLANDYEKRLFEYSPELGVFWGKSNVALDRFTDISMEGYAKWQQEEDNFLLKLYSINEQDLKDSPLYITYQLLKETLEAKKASRLCREELWDVNPTLGWHNMMAMLAEKQPVGTAKYRQLALKRWRTFGKTVDDLIDNLKIGLSLGYTAPKPAVLRVLNQLDILLSTPMKKSPYFDFARRDGDPLFKKQVSHIMQTVLLPSLKKYRDFLAEDYYPLARNEVGVLALPSGAECYQAKIRQETTLDLTPATIHTLGLQAMKKLSKEVGEIGLKKYNSQNMVTVFQLANKESLNYFSTEQDLLDYNVAALKKAQAAVPRWFDTLPKAQGIIKPYPLHRAKTGASGEYHPPNEEGTEPGIFYINTYQPKKRSRIDQEATLYHELIPGHHFQIALLYENQALPTLNHYLFNSGFTEGWALYVERLAEEMGLYQDDISRLGMLSNESLRVARLVVDTGLHAFHWSRESAVNYLKQHTALSENIIEGEVDRYIMMPGQATAYMLGKMEIDRLRQLAKDQLATRFDIRQFHQQVLKNGTVTLPMLRTQIENWLQVKPEPNLG